MVRGTAAAIVVAAVLAATGGARAETPIPDAPTRWITDDAGFLGPAARDEVDKRLAAYARATGHQVIVYIGRTTGGVPIEDWAVKAFERWKVGRKGIDDGLALFIFSADRAMRIEVGYGLEPIMIDAKASQIIRNVLAPRIRQGDRDGAVRAGVDAILTTLGGKSDNTPAPPRRRFSDADKRTLWIVVLGLLAIPVLLLLLVGAVVLFFPGKIRLRRAGSGSERIASDEAPSTESESSGSSSGDDGFSGGGGESGGGGASGSW